MSCGKKKLICIVVFFFSLSDFVSAAAEKVVLQLKWQHQFQFAGYYAAKEKGFYLDAGFNVEIVPFNNTVSPVNAVLNGTADFGVADSSLILHRLMGRPVVVLGAIFQHSPLVLLTRESDNLLGPNELTGKRVMYQKNANGASVMALLHLLNADNDIEHVPHSFNDDDLLTSKVDAMSAYVTDQPFYYQSQGLSVHAINPVNYGIDFYGDMLFASEDTVRRDPKRMQDFLNASVKGWAYALAHKDEVIAWITKKYHSPKSIKHLQYEAQEIEKTILPKVVKIGHINHYRFEHIANIYREQKLAPKDAEFTGISLPEYFEASNASPLLPTVLMWMAGFFSFVALGLYAMNRQLNVLARDRNRKLFLANDKLAQYSSIIDQYVISSQTDTEGIITDVSEAFCLVSGYSKEELIGASHNIVRHPDTPKEFYKQMWDTIKQGKSWAGEIKNLSKNGSVFWVEANMRSLLNSRNEIIGYASVRTDITDKKRVEHLSITDKLTGLCNRYRLDEVLNLEFARVQRYSAKLSLILCDIDSFKKVNDQYGHLIGDQILVDIAELLLLNSREVDVVGRWGGEEFLIICIDTSLSGAIDMAEKLRVQVEFHKFLDVGPQTVSFGVTTIGEGDSLVDVMQMVDSALYKAKESGRNRVETIFK